MSTSLLVTDLTEKKKNRRLSGWLGRVFSQPREVWIGVLGMPLIGVAIGAFNYYNIKKDFRAAVRDRVQRGYERQARRYSRANGIERSALTADEYEKFVDKEQCLQGSRAVDLKENFVSGSKQSWLVAGVITGFMVGSIASGLILASLPASAIVMPAFVAVLLIGGGFAAAAGLLANGISSFLVPKDADAIISDEIRSPKNQQGIDIVAQEAKQNHIDVQKKRIIEKVQKKEAGFKKIIEKKIDQKDSFVEREMQRREAKSSVDMTV